MLKHLIFGALFSFCAECAVFQKVCAFQVCLNSQAFSEVLKTVFARVKYFFDGAALFFQLLVKLCG